MKHIIQELLNKLRTQFVAEVENPPRIPAVKVYRFTDERIEMPGTDHPYLYIVLDGMLRLYTPSGIMDYMAGQLFVNGKIAGGIGFGGGTEAQDCEIAAYVVSVFEKLTAEPLG